MNEMPDNGAPQSLKKPNKGASELFDWVQCIVTTLVVCILIFVFLGRTVGVNGSSMYRTLEEGDRLIISSLFYTPKYGDIVVLRQESFADYPLVKRVIATEGQTIDIDFEAGIVYVDGVALDEPYTNTPTNEPEDFTDEVTVPEGCIFVMGDNRNRSTDSRTASIGCVDTRCVIGKALFRITPISKFGGIY
jgi:signal peptidase I